MFVLNLHTCATWPYLDILSVLFFANLFSVLIASKAYSGLYKLTKQNLNQGNKVDRLNLVLFCLIHIPSSSVLAIEVMHIQMHIPLW